MLSTHISVLSSLPFHPIYALYLGFTLYYVKMSYQLIPYLEFLSSSSLDPCDLCENVIVDIYKFLRLLSFSLIYREEVWEWMLSETKDAEFTPH